MCASFPFGFEWEGEGQGMWDSVVLIPEHYFSMYFIKKLVTFSIQINLQNGGRDYVFDM